jgi:hypothetical protein
MKTIIKKLSEILKKCDILKLYELRCELKKRQ